MLKKKELQVRQKDTEEFCCVCIASIANVNTIKMDNDLWDTTAVFHTPAWATLLISHCPKLLKLLSRRKIIYLPIQFFLSLLCCSIINISPLLEDFKRLFWSYRVPWFLKYCCGPMITLMSIYIIALSLYIQ